MNPAKARINTRPLVVGAILESLIILGGLFLFVRTGSLFWVGAATSLGIGAIVFTILLIRSSDAPPREQGSIVEDARGRR